MLKKKKSILKKIAVKTTTLNNKISRLLLNTRYRLKNCLK